MTDLSTLARAWDGVYNGVLIGGTGGYLITSVLRVLTVWAAWRLLAALHRYVSVAVPPPHTAANVVYWLRWWMWLRWQQDRTLKISAVYLSVLLLLQLPAGVGGKLAALSPYLVQAHPALILLLIGFTRLLNRLSHRIEHPDEVPT